MKLLITFVLSCLWLFTAAQSAFAVEFNKAAESYGAQDYKAAISSFNKALKEKNSAKNNYQVADVYIYRGYAYFYLKNTKAALTDINQALALKPEYMRAHEFKSLVLFNTERYDECIAACDAGLAYNQNKDELLLTKADALLRLKKMDEALETIRKSLINNPKNIRALDLRGGAYLKKKMWDSAIASYAEILEINPNDPATLFNRGISYSHIKEYDLAKKDIEQAMKIDTAGKFVGYNNLGFFLKLEQKLYKEAIEYFDKAIEVKPDFAYAYSNRAFAKINIGDASGAMKDIKKSLELDPTNSYAYKNFGIIYLKTGDVAKACKNFQKALDLDYAKDYDEEAEELQKANCR
jgi:tetratricopeptide (TPR) repeat protein